jgi:hypothetical protein
MQLPIVGGIVALGQFRATDLGTICRDVQRRWREWKYSRVPSFEVTQSTVQ